MQKNNSDDISCFKFFPLPYKTENQLLSAEPTLLYMQSVCQARPPSLFTGSNWLNLQHYFFSAVSVALWRICNVTKYRYEISLCIKYRNLEEPVMEKKPDFSFAEKAGFLSCRCV